MKNVGFLADFWESIKGFTQPREAMHGREHRSEVIFTPHGHHE